MEDQKTTNQVNLIQLHSLKWVDDELAMIQDQYSATLSAINFPCYTQSSSKTKDYLVVVDGKVYGMVREINCGNRFEYRALMEDGNYIEPVSDVFHVSAIGAVCELARRHHDNDFANQLTDYVIAVSQVQELASAQLRKKHERPVVGTLPNDRRSPLRSGRTMMIYAGRKRKATEAQIRLILKLTDQSDLNNVKNLENCPPVVRYKEDLNKKYLDNRTAAKIIDGLIQWKEIYG